MIIALSHQNYKLAITLKFVSVMVITNILIPVIIVITKILIRVIIIIITANSVIYAVILFMRIMRVVVRAHK